MKHTVSKRALVQRINRRLKRDGLQLRSPRGGCHRLASSVRHFIVDIKRGVVREPSVDVMAKAKQLGLLKAWEES